MFQVSEEWKSAYPGACAGALALAGVTNPEHHPALDARKEALEAELRARWAGQDRKALVALPVMRAYGAHYSRFRKTYHVLLQLESVALKGKSLPRAAALVEAMFMAELKNGLLTGRHDLAALELPVTVRVAGSDERYVTLGGREQAPAAGDMCMCDGQAVISSIIYGPDAKTAICPATQRAIFTVYGPAGIAPAAVRAHLDDICELVRVVAPAATVELCEVYAAP